MENRSSDLDTGLICVALLARFFGLPCSPEQLEHWFGGFGRTSAVQDVITAARFLGLKARLSSADWDKLTNAPLPAIVELDPGRFAVLAKVGQDTVLLQDPRQQRPQTLSKSEFLASWSGQMVLVTKRHRLLDGRDGPHQLDSKPDLISEIFCPRILVREGAEDDPKKTT